MIDAGRTLTNNITLLMREAVPRLNQTDVANRMGVNQTTVGRILSGAHSPTLKNLQALALGFKLQTWQLLVPDLGRKVDPQQSGLSPVAVRLAEKFDAISSPADKQKAFAYLVQVLDFAAFNTPPGVAVGQPFPAPKPAPARTRKTRRAPSP